MAADRGQVRKFLKDVVAGVATVGRAVVLTTGKTIDEINVTLLKIGTVALTATAAELNKNAGVTAGTVTASKVVVVDANKDVGTFRNVTLSGNLVSGSTTLDETDLAKIDGITNGTAAASKAVVLNANKHVDEINTASLKLGATGATVAVTATAAELNEADASTVGAQRKFRKAALTIAADTNPHDTAIVIPAGSIILGAYIDVQTREATGGTKTVDIGISSGDENGFLAGVSVASAGTVKGTLVSTGQTLGALLSVNEDGTSALVPEPYVCSAETTICYTLGSADFAELVANVIVEYIDIA